MGQGKTARIYEYELGHSDRELKRLQLQAELVDPFTRQFYRDAGVTAGMRVLDVATRSPQSPSLRLASRRSESATYRFATEVWIGWNWRKNSTPRSGDTF